MSEWPIGVAVLAALLLTGMPIAFSLTLIGVVGTASIILYLRRFKQIPALESTSPPQKHHQQKHQSRHKAGSPATICN